MASQLSGVAIIICIAVGFTVSNSMFEQSPNRVAHRPFQTFVLIFIFGKVRNQVWVVVRVLNAVSNSVKLCALR